MTAYAAGQQSASNPVQFQVGVPIGPMLDGYAIGAQCSTDVLVGSACFYVDTFGADTTIAQTSATDALFAGIVMRSNANPMPFSASYAGFSSTISAGLEATVCLRTSIPVLIAVANEGAAPLIGSAVYAMSGTGLWETQTVAGSAPVGGVLTNFRVMRVPAGWTTASPVLISNIQNVGA
jgi:hypothetical protein